MRPLVDKLEERVGEIKDDLANGMIAIGDYPHIIGFIKGLRESIQIVKDWEAKQMKDGDKEWLDVLVDNEGSEPREQR